MTPPDPPSPERKPEGGNPAPQGVDAVFAILGVFLKVAFWVVVAGIGLVLLLAGTCFLTR